MESHKHCLYCGVSVQSNETFCTEKCRDAFIAGRKKVLMMQRVLIAILAGLFIFILLRNLGVP